MNLPNNRIQSTGSTIGHTGMPATSGRLTGSHSGHTYSATPLQEGQIVKGEIKDLRNNEITLLLADDTTILANISDHTNLTIGQTASFKIIELSPKGIALENLSKNITGMQDLTILKALEEAEIPKTERNISIVRELLNQRMPIHKESIQQMIRHALSNPDVSVESLVLMKKHHLPMNKVSAMQFEHYRNGEHSLIGEIERLSDSLPNLLSALAENGSEGEVAAFGNRLMSILTDSMPEFKMSNLDLTFMPMDAREALVEQLTKILPSDHPLLNAGGELIVKDSILDGSMPLREVRDLLTSVLTNNESVASDPPVTGSPASDSTNSPTAAVSTTTDPNTADTVAAESTDTKASDHEPSQSTRNGIAGAHPYETSTNHATTTISISEAPSIPTPSNPSGLSLRTITEQIEEQWKGMRQINQEIGSFLQPAERNELLDRFKPLSLPTEIKDRIQLGNATLKETLYIIQKQLSANNPTGIKELLTSHSFHSLLKEAIQTNWMMTPSTLMQKEKVDQFYPKMLQELNEVTVLIQNNLEGQDTNLLTDQSKSMQQNIDFMKSLNQMFSYIQLPMHLKDKNIHSDLYVYTKKQEMKKHPNKLRALLHLDMESLGELDIDITLENSSVNTTFFCTDAFSTSILETNLSLLEESLAENGFLFHAHVVNSTKGFDMVKDLIEAESPSVGMTRYSFDIRA